MANPDVSTSSASSKRIATLLAVGVALHCAFGVLRIPHAVIGKRVADVTGLQDEGDVSWLMARARLTGAEVILEVRDNTPENAVVPVRGLFKGALEYVPPLLWPRLCCRVEALAAGASEHLGRPVAPYVIVSDGDSLLLERR